MSLLEKYPHVNPGKSTVYMANLPYDLKSEDIQETFERYGTIIKVTLLTVKETRKSKGVAFVLFERPEDAKRCVEDTNNKVMFGQILRASFAKDNGKRPNLAKKPVTDNYNYYPNHQRSTYAPY